jgi:pyruvate/2-oxoglutarate dehydrogenase complex dihydrolipoamide acyltransferase (E2) component
MEDVEVEDAAPQPVTPNDEQGEPAVVTPTATRHDSVNGQTNRQLLLSVMGATNSLRRVVTEYGNSIESMRGSITRQERTLRGLVRRIDANPLQQLQRAAQGQARGRTTTAPASPSRRTGDPRAVLSPNPRTLSSLWDKYVHGIGNNKPAREFTSAERGRCKYKYSRQKLVWNVIESLVRGSLSSHDAIERMYTHYGANLSVTSIINRLRVDKRNLPATLRI